MGSPWGAAITSVSAGLQAIVGNKAYQNALDAQKVGAAQGAATREKQYKETQGFIDPYNKAGQVGLNQAQNMLTPGYQFNASDPSYQWRLEQGQKALERSAASKGQLLSGGMLKSLAGYSQGMASQEYGNQFGRAMGLAGLGYNAASQQAGYSNAFGNTQAAGQEGIANAEAANIMSKYQNWQNLDSQAAGAWSGYFGSKGGGTGSSQNTAGNYGASVANTQSYGSTNPNGGYNYANGYNQPWGGGSGGYGGSTANNGTGFGSANYGSANTGQAGNYSGSWQQWAGGK